MRLFRRLSVNNINSISYHLLRANFISIISFNHFKKKKKNCMVDITLFMLWIKVIINQRLYNLTKRQNQDLNTESSSPDYL